MPGEYSIIPPKTGLQHPLSKRIRDHLKTIVSSVVIVTYKPSYDTSYGNFVNDVKTWLVVKNEAEARAPDLFKDSRINITTEGSPYLGALIGTSSFIHNFFLPKCSSGGQSSQC